jgi:uncharacterized membrane protein YoaK (UPF0700 family)
MKVTSDVSQSISLTVLLTLSGGLMDAYSYMCRDRVFANAQTGNILLFGVHLVEGNIMVSLRYLIPVLAFAAGITAAELFCRFIGEDKRLHWRQLVLIAEALILAGVAFIPAGYSLPANSLISFACGAQVESFRVLSGGKGVATTMCIGNLRSATQHLCDYRFSHDKAALQSGLLYLGIIAVFVCGAVTGDLLVDIIGGYAILGSAALLLAGAVLMHIRKES